MAVLSRMAFDARAAVPADDLAAGTDVQLRMATRVSAEAAREWAAKKPADGQLTALVDLPDAARLNVAAWLDALQPDVVELRTPAWSEAGMAAIEWPEGLAVLQRVLGALSAAQVTTRLALHVSALTLPELQPAALDTLAQQAGADALTLMLRPVLGEHAPRLDVFAQSTVALWQSGHTVKGTRLLPACALPEGVDCEPTYASERAAAKQDYTPECSGCPAREEGRCDGMPADLLSASVAAGVAWTGWPTFAKDREPVVIVNEPDDTLEEIALRLGIRRVWRSELPLEEAEVLAAHPPEGLIVLAGSHVTLDPQSALQFDTPGSTAQILYLAQEQMDAEAARSADMAAESGDPERVAAAHRDLAKLLGYPDCCAEAFVAALTARQEASAQGLTEHAFAVLQAARASKNLDRRLNFGSPIDDACLVRHVVCTYDCTASLAQVAEMENELSVIAPGRLATKLALRVDAALVFADSAHLPVRGELAEDGSLRNPVIVAEWDPATPRGKVAQRAYDAIADQLAQAVAIAASQPIEGPGGVIVTLADGTQVALGLGDLPTHQEFPRLLVFAADAA
jgi:hypothetical protein